MSSIKVFRDFLERSPETGEINAVRVVSVECFNAWKKTSRSSNPAHAFRRSLYTHLSGTDGLIPFDKDEAIAIRDHLMEIHPYWECFGYHVKVPPYRGILFHTRLEQGQVTDVKKRARLAKDQFTTRQRKTDAEKEEALEEEGESEEEEEQERNQPSVSTFKLNNIGPLGWETKAATHEPVSVPAPYHNNSFFAVGSAISTVYGRMMDQFSDCFPMRKALDVAKYVFFAHGIFGPILTEAEADAWLERTQQELGRKLPDELMLVFNPVASSIDYSVYAMNDVGLKVLGYIRERDGGIKGEIPIPDKYVLTIHQSIHQSHASPGLEVPGIQVELRTRKGVLEKVTLGISSLRHPQTPLTLWRGRINIEDFADDDDDDA